MKKMNKNIFICALLVLMIFLCVNTVSAEDSLNDNLTSTDTTPVAAVDVEDNSLGADDSEISLSDNASNDVLGDEGNIIVVSNDDDGDYKTISDAVGAATGGETIYVKNGEYSEANTITFTKSLSIIGESQDGVKITGAAKSLFSTVEPALTLSFTNLTILNAGGSSNAAFKATYSAHDISIINCTFDNCGSKWGTIQFGYPGIGVIDGCRILNSKATVSASSGALYFSGAGNYTVKNTVIDTVGYTPTNSYMYGAIYISNAKAVVDMDNVTISNVSGPSRGVIFTSGTLNVNNSRIINNNLSKYGTQSNSIICVANNAKADIEQTEISGNTCVDELFTNVGDNSNTIVNYCNIQNNNASGIVSSKGSADLEYNWWGSNDKPLDSININIIEENGVYKLSDGSDLTKIIPGLNDEKPVENIIYVATNGSDENDGLSKETAVATLQKAIELSNGKIVMLEGTYSISDNVNIDKNLEIAADGAVTLNLNSKTITNNAVLKFENVLFTRASNVVPITNEGTLTVVGCNFTGFAGTGSGIIYSKSGSKLNIDGCAFINNIKTSSAATVYILIIESAEATIVNSQISSNQGQGSCPVTIKGGSDVLIDNCTFKSNSYMVGNGGALNIIDTSNVKVFNSDFIANIRMTQNYPQLPANGAAIYQGGTSTLTIYKSRFIDNQCVNIRNNQPVSDSAILVAGGTLDISYSVLLNAEGNNLKAVATSGSSSVTANYNWWGSNDGANAAVPVDNWVILDAGYEPVVVENGDEITVSAIFDQYKTADGQTGYLEDSIPSVDVTFTSNSGNLSATQTTEDGVAFINYNVNLQDSEITVSSSNAVVTLPIKVFEGIIYVATNGSDENSGTKDNPVATLAKAIELSNGKIFIMEGNYTIDATLAISKDVDIEAIGEVVIDGNQLRIIENTANLNITGVAFKNAKAGFGSVLLNDGNATLVGCEVYSSTATGTSAGIVHNRAGTLTVEDCDFYENAAKRGVVSSASGTSLNIKDSRFYNNDATSTYSTNTYGIVYSASANTLIENTVFINNKVQKGGAIYANRASSVTTGEVIIKDCLFANNTALNGEAGAVHASGTVVVKIYNSTFVNNTAIKSSSSVGGRGAAVYVSGTSDVTIDQCVFVDNSGSDDSAIYVYGTSSSNSKLAISNSVLLAKDGDELSPLVKADDELASNVVANDNWWGDNTKANTLVPVERWVIMNVTYAPENVIAGDGITITLSFTQYNSTSGVGDLTKFIPDGYTAIFATDAGIIADDVEVDNGIASVDYTVGEGDSEIIVSYLGREAVIPIDIINLDVVYVSLSGSDSNSGTRDSPVATLERALKISSNVVFLEGTYKLGDLGSIYQELNISGEGNVIIDCDNDGRFLYVGSDGDVTLTNLTIINGYTTATSQDSGALLGNSGKLTIINCTLANSTSEANGGAIYSVGKLTIINSTIENNIATLGGAIYADKYLGDEAVVIQNSRFIGNVARGGNNKNGGAIYAQAFKGTFTITNTSFVSNRGEKEYGGGAIYGLQLGNVVITDSEFINNTAGSNEYYGGGAISFIGGNYQNEGSLTITNTLFEDNQASSNGAAVYVKGSTLKISSSVLINNTDDNGYALFRATSSGNTASLTANDNWWGSNDSPKSFINGGTLSRWAILTVTNDTAISEGNTVKITVSINSYTTGTENGTLDNHIKVERPVTITTNDQVIEGVLTDGEFTTDYVVPTGLKYIYATVDDETVILYTVPTVTTVEIDNVTAKKYEKVNITVNVTSDDGTIVNSGVVELYIAGDLIATLPVINGTVSKEIVVNKDIGDYEMTAKFVDDMNLFVGSQNNATFSVDGLCELVNATFFNYFDEEGNLRSEITENELVFHGEFSGLGVDVVTINRPITVSGDEAVLYNMAFAVKSDDVKVTNMSFIALSKNFASNSGAVIYITDVMNTTLDKVAVTYITPSNANAYAVYANKATDFKLLDSLIIFDGNNRGVQVYHHGIEIRDCDDVLIKGNDIEASLPSADVSWSGSGINKDYPLAIGIQSGENIVLTENKIFVETEPGSGSYTTVDSIMADSFTNLTITKNNITHVDFTGSGKAGYTYVVDLYNFNQALVAENNILVNTTTGVEAAGTAYPIQLTGPFTDIVIDHNNLTTLSKGPALGIFASHYETGDAEALITNNFINVTGYATANDWALVSGIEFEGTLGQIYNNTIYVQSITPYADSNSLYGISFAQVMGTTHEFDIRDNTIYSEGKYAVYIGKATNSNIVENTLYGHELTGDDAAIFTSGSGNVIENNYPRIPESVIVEVPDVFEGQPITVTVTVPGATGNVTIKVNNKEYIVDLEEGVAVKEISDYGDDFTVNVTYNGDTKFFPSGNSTTFAVMGNVVVNDTFFKYFDEYGNLREEVPFEELIFKGEFSNVSDYITIEKALRITGEDALLYDIGFIIVGTDIALDNMTLIANGDMGDLIAVTYSDTVTLSNMDISYVTAKPGNAIHVFSSNNVDIISNNVYFESTVENYAVDKLTNAICIDTELDMIDVMMGDIDYITGIAVDNNNITAVIPAFLADAYEHEYYVMGLSAVNGVRINGVEDLEFTNNNLDVTTNRLYRTTPTYQAMYIAASTGLVDGNNISMIDTFTPEGKDVYLYAMEVIYDTDLTISNNNFDISTAGGIADAGAAYAIQAVASEFTVTSNNITTESNGPNIGIYFPSSMGAPCEATIKGNIIEVTGLATDKYTGLVTGIEAQCGELEIKDNIIYTYNVGQYDDNNTIYGISYAQEGSTSTFEIVNNTIFTEGCYAISFIKTDDAVVTDNYLIADELFGDDAVQIKDGSDNVVENNRPFATNLTVSAQNITVGEVAVIEVALTESAVGTVKVIVNGKTYIVDNIVAGKGSVEVDGLAASTYGVTAVFESLSPDYISVENSTEFTVSKIESNITVEIPSDIAAGDNVTIEITIPNATGMLTVIVDGNENNVRLSDGKANVTIENITAGDHTVVTIYGGDANVDFQYNLTTFKVSKVDCAVEASAEPIKVGEDATIIVEVPSDATGHVIVDIAGKQYYGNITGGKASVVVPGLTANTTADVSYSGDGRYNANTTSVDVVVEKVSEYNMTINSTSENGKTTVSVELPKDATGNLTVTDSEGNNYTAPVEAGKASVDIKGLPEGENNLTVAYSGDDKYDPVSSNTTVNATKEIKQTVLSGDKLEMIVGDGSKFTVTLTDKDGNPVSGKGIKISIVGKIYTVKTDSNGQASLPINLKAGSYPVTALFNGDADYAQSNAVMTSVEVYTNMRIAENKDLVKDYKDDSKPFKVRALDKYGKPVGAYAKVKMTIAGKTYTVNTDSNGYASLPINLKPGTYQITTEYGGSKVTNQITVKGVLSASDATYNKASSYKYFATLKGSNGKAIVGKTVTFTISGKTYSANTDSNGKATITINQALNVGKYTITSKYGDTSVSKTITIK